MSFNHLSYRELVNLYSFALMDYMKSQSTANLQFYAEVKRELIERGENHENT